MKKNEFVSIIVLIIGLSISALILHFLVTDFLSGGCNGPIGDTFKYDFHGVLEDYYFPPDFDGPGDWAYHNNELGSDSFVSFKMDGKWRGSFTCCVVDLEQYLNESVTVYCSGCCYDDCIDDVVRDSDWWIFWK